MAPSTSEEIRQRAEAKLNKAQRTNDEAAAIIQSNLAAARAKTARLREERLAKEAREGVSELDKKSQRPPRRGR